MKKIAIVFPGQGSQTVGMLQSIAKVYPIIGETFAEASQAFGKDLWLIVSEGPVETLNQTEVTQPALLTASVALWRIWQQKHGILPVVLAGHSLGEYTALVCANAISLTDAVGIVAERGRFMQEAVSIGQGAMAAIIGLAEAIVQTLCEEASQGEVVSVANFNAPGQIVIAGHAVAVERVMDIAKKSGAKLVKRLDVSVPSHCALMKEAANRLMISIDKVSWRLPTIPVIQNIDADSAPSVSALKSALYRQLFLPVQWVKSVQTMIEHYEVTEMIECGPGKVLTGLNKRITSVPTWPIEPLLTTKDVQYDDFFRF